MKYLGIIVISLFFLLGCNTHDSDNSQNNKDSQGNNNLGASSQPLKKISNIIYTDYIDGASTRVAMVMNGFEVLCEGQTNKECGGACGRKTYADSDNNNFICCPSGETDRYGARDYCTEMPVNSTCASDTMCANGACGRKEAGDDNLICCPIGATNTYAGLDYCAEIPNGNSCWSDAMCSSNYCRGNDGGVEKGTCSPTNLSNGSKCSTNGECKNNACGRKTAAKHNDHKLICCPSNHIYNFPGNWKDYCTDLSKGSSCWVDKMCHKNHNCKGNWDGAERGTCQ